MSRWTYERLSQNLDLERMDLVVKQADKRVRRFDELYLQNPNSRDSIPDALEVEELLFELLQVKAWTRDLFRMEPRSFPAPWFADYEKRFLQHAARRFPELDRGILADERFEWRTVEEGPTAQRGRARRRSGASVNQTEASGPECKTCFVEMTLTNVSVEYADVSQPNPIDLRDERVLTFVCPGCGTISEFS